jgi:nucleoside-diphosphate-sugar epimerase
VDRLQVVVIQPTVVYGPRAGVYGRDILDELRTSRIPLVDGGAGVCNALFVDDLVTALLLAATSDSAVGECFLVSGPEHPTWAAFFRSFERMLGVERLVPMSASSAVALWRSRKRTWLLPEAMRAIRHDTILRTRLLATREGLVVRRIAERVLPESFYAPQRWSDERAALSVPPADPPLVPFRPEVVRFLASRARVHSTKARELLGYRPAFGLDDGMRLTEAWARWEGLLDRERGFG